MLAPRSTGRLPRARKAREAWFPSIAGITMDSPREPAEIQRDLLLRPCAGQQYWKASVSRYGTQK
jgi:hypothetical protein